MLEQVPRPMTRTEKLELMIYYELEPFGEKRADLRFGQLLAMLYNGIFKPAAEPALTMDDFVMFDAELQHERRQRYDRILRRIKRADLLAAGAPPEIADRLKEKRKAHGR